MQLSRVNLSGAPVICCCGVLEEELNHLSAIQFSETRIRFLDSLLHMRPDILATRIEAILDEELNAGHPVVLVYGDCCAQMKAFKERSGLVRTKGSNCCELLLGRSEYRRYMKNGVFFLLPEWTLRWHEIFSTELGLNQENARTMMQDMHREILYLDTGINPVPHDSLRECSEYCGLPVRIFPTSLDILKHTIQEAIGQVMHG